MSAIAIPKYLLSDEDLESFLERAMEIMTELAGEEETPELPPLIQALRAEQTYRMTTVYATSDKDA